MKKVEEIVVRPDSELFMWGIDTAELDYDATLTVSMGCQVLYIVNGNLSNVFDAGRYIINPKKQHKANNSIALIGVNRGKTFSLAWGVGEIPFRDRETRVETEFGMNGEYTLQLLQAANLYTAFGRADVSPNDIAEKTRAKLAETLKTQLSKQLSNYTYLTLQSAQGQISDMIRDAFNKELFAIGFTLQSFALKEFCFPDDFKQARAAGDAYDERLRRKREERDQRMAQEQEAAVMGEFLRNVNAAAAAAQAAADVKCPVCGTVCASGTLFCPKCGKKL